MQLKVLFLNCTLKYSPEVSNTRALIDTWMAQPFATYPIPTILRMLTEQARAVSR